MKRSTHFRFSISLVLLLSLVSPLAALAFADGKKHFKEGMKQESAEVWDKAVEEFALAVSDSPKNPEYRLHLTRALFNASQMYMKKGTAAAKEKDYEGGYVAFRKAYAFDPTNELAKSEMDRMVRLQKEVNEGTPGDKKDDAGKLKMVPTAYNSQTAAPAGQMPQMPQKLEKLRDIPFPSGVDLQYIIKELARDLDLNVLFDSESFRGAPRKTQIDLKNVTAAFALDCIFLQEGLFFQKVGPHTIMVANQQQRVKFQQLVLRTFYLSNASPKDVAKVVQTAIPAQPGRSQTIVLTDDSTNSITIRDTEENIRLIGKLIQSLDKDRAEVVMDVAIYEVNKTDLMQFGNQLGSTGSGGTLSNIGGVGFPIVRSGPTSPITGHLPFTGADALGIALGLPVSSISALQTKSNTKLIASTQIHAFNNEDSSARIGQRVPVKSATFQTGGNIGGTGVVSDVINYEQVGLTLKFKPLVFPNQDVQVAMEIESKDVAGSGINDNPIFTERTIKGTARVQNNKTLLLASVAQGTETNGRSGLPLLGLIPIIGRLFSAPTRDNRQVDIVIAVTPRVIRAPAILPEDEEERQTGSLAVPTNSTLEGMIIEDERQEMLATARREQNVAKSQVQVQLPDRPLDSPEYVKSSTAGTDQQGASSVPESTTAKSVDVSTAPALKPIDNGVKTLQLNQTADTSMAAKPDVEQTPPAGSKDDKAAPMPSVELRIGADLPEMKAGDKLRVPVLIDGSGIFRSAVMGLKFDDKKIAVRSVQYGDVFGTAVANAVATPFLNQNGKMFVSLTSQDGKEMNAAGTLAFIEIEALSAGQPSIAFDRDVLNFLTSDGKNFVVKIKE